MAERTRGLRARGLRARLSTTWAVRSPAFGNAQEDGGWIEIGSPAGGGARFDVLLPLCREHGAPDVGGASASSERLTARDAPASLAS